MILIPPHPLTNFEIWKYQIKPRFCVVYSRNNLAKIKYGGIFNKSIGTLGIGLHLNLCSSNDCEKNDKIILKYFHQLKRGKTYMALFVRSIETFKNLNYHIFEKKH